MVERRRITADRRQALRIPAVFAVKKALPTGVQLCQAEDIGPAGITIRRPKGTTVQPRTEVALSFALPGSNQEIAARGVVITDSQAGSFRRTGVRFIALRPEHQQLIVGYCRQRPVRR